MSDPTSPENSGSEKKPRRPARKKAAKKKAQSKSKAGAAESSFDLPTAPEKAEFTIIGGDGAEYGPRPIEVVRRWIATGRANARTLARTAPDAAWQPLGQIPELVPLFEESRPPLPGKVTAIAIITLTGGLVTLAWPLWLWDLNLGFWWWSTVWRLEGLVHK